MKKFLVRFLFLFLKHPIKPMDYSHHFTEVVEATNNKVHLFKIVQSEGITILKIKEKLFVEVLIAHSKAAFERFKTNKDIYGDI